jgi:hypothetical protein
MSSFVLLCDRPARRIVVLAMYYLLVHVMLFVMYVYKDFVTPSYIYQEF